MPPTAQTSEYYRRTSFWLEDANDPLTPRPPLPASQDCDVAILGGGFTGLWTACYLLRANPRLRITILESEICGYGASGRNGGWCSPRFPLSPAAMTRRWGPLQARATLDALQHSFHEIESFAHQHAPDIAFRPAGTLTVARYPHELPYLLSSLNAYKALGMKDRYRLLTPDQVNQRVCLPGNHGGLFTPDGASLHPGRLVRALARAVESLGATIHEQTAVLNWRDGRQASSSRPGQSQSAALLTAAGELRASQAIVLAGEAYLTRLPKTHRALLPAYSLISLTAPLTPAQWSNIGWQAGENLSSPRNTVVYLTRTPDGRILFGSRGAPYQFASKITHAQDRHPATIDHIQHSLIDWFPSLAGIPFTHSWGGPVGMPIDWTPSVRFNPATRIAFAGGYTGQGVSTSNLAGQILSSLILASLTTGQASHYQPSPHTSLPFVNRRSPDWIPEPLRFLTVRYMQNGYQRIDHALEHNQPLPPDAWLIQKLGSH